VHRAGPDLFDTTDATGNFGISAASSSNRRVKVIDMEMRSMA